MERRSERYRRDYRVAVAAGRNVLPRGYGAVDGDRGLSAATRVGDTSASRVAPDRGVSSILEERVGQEVGSAVVEPADRRGIRGSRVCVGSLPERDGRAGT